MSAQVWQPQEAAVHQIVQLLTEYQNPGANQAQVRCLAVIGQGGGRAATAGWRRRACAQ